MNGWLVLLLNLGWALFGLCLGWALGVRDERRMWTEALYRHAAEMKKEVES